jgi:hypothetical protein
VSAILLTEIRLLRRLGTYLTSVNFISPELVLTVEVPDPSTLWDSLPAIHTS